MATMGNETRGLAGHETGFLLQTVTLFLAFRLADLVNLAAGLYLVPKYVNAADLGAVLPVSTFATTVSIPAFAFAMVFMREGAVLYERRAWGEWKSLVKGVFVVTGCLLALGGLVAAVTLPGFLRAVGVTDATVATLALSGAFLGSVAPVYSDALNAIQRYRALGTVEIGAALARLGTLAILMPFRALAGYFAGGVIQPLARVAGSLILLRHELAMPAAPYWTRPVARRLVLLALGVTLYLLTPLLASLAEQSVLRLSLGPEDSAAYYLLTRLSGLINYLSIPLLFVLFPRAARSGDNPRAVRRLVRGCQAATAVLALALALPAAFAGQTVLAWLPNGENYGASAVLLPLLILAETLNACQIYDTNAAVAAGRLRFLLWHAPLNLVYALLLTLAPNLVHDLPSLLLVLTSVATLRFLFAAIGSVRVQCRQPNAR